MGYTHYFTQNRSFTLKEWAEVCEELSAILAACEKKGIKFGDAGGDKGTRPEVTKDRFWFNGIGKNAHETMCINRKLGDGEFCKTERKPYDLAVTACLAYLATVRESHHVTTDGYGADWLDGVALVRIALPKYANIVDIPKPIMQDDRWICPHVSQYAPGYRPRFCIDGHGYVIRTHDGAAVYFESHLDLAKWLESTKAPLDTMRPRRVGGFGETPARESDIWNAMGSFDKARQSFLGRLQRTACEALFNAPRVTMRKPPDYVRPDAFPRPDAQFYYVRDLISAACAEG